MAVALANGETSVDGIDQEIVDDSIGELIAIGILEDVVSIPCIDPAKTVAKNMLELRYP